MTIKEVYEIVYDTIAGNIASTDSRVASNDLARAFARALPAPASLSDEDAAALCSLVSAGTTEGLEQFFNVSVQDSGLVLGEFVRKELPAYRDYDQRRDELVARFRSEGRLA